MSPEQGWASLIVVKRGRLVLVHKLQSAGHNRMHISVHWPGLSSASMYSMEGDRFQCRKLRRHGSAHTDEIFLSPPCHGKVLDNTRLAKAILEREGTVEVLVDNEYGSLEIKPVAAEQDVRVTGPYLGAHVLHYAPRLFAGQAHVVWNDAIAEQVKMPHKAILISSDGSNRSAQGQFPDVEA